MPLVGEHQAEDRQLITELVLAKLNQLVEREANAPQRPTTIQPSQVRKHKIQHRRHFLVLFSPSCKHCFFRELVRRAKSLASSPRTAPGVHLKVACSIFSTVTALLWVQNQSRPTEKTPGRRSSAVRAQGTK